MPYPTNIVIRTTKSSGPTATAVKGGWLDFVPAIALLIVSSVGIFATALSPSGDRGQYAVVAPFWYNLDQTLGLIDSAGGEILEFGDLQNVVIVHSDNPRFARALYLSGAWLVIDPVGLRGCFGFKRTPPRPAEPV